MESLHDFFVERLHDFFLCGQVAWLRDFVCGEVV